MNLLKRSYSDEELVEGCRQNQRKHQEALYRKYFDLMYGMCLKHTRDEEQSLDILNRGFLKVFMQIGQFEGKGSLKAWIRTIVYRCMADWFRENKQYIRFISLQEDAETDMNTNRHEQPVMGDYDIQVLLAGLPNRMSDVFRLYAIEGYSHKEIAESLGINVGTSKWHLSEARKKLKGIIQAQEGRKLPESTLKQGL